MYMENPLTPNEKSALERLIAHAKSDTGQGGRVANFLLSWWNADTQGKFDLREVWSVDDDIAADMLTVLGFMVRVPNVYPDRLGYEPDFQEIISTHR